MLFLATISDLIYQPAVWLAAIAIILALGFGIADFLRFSFTRSWAISGVCFDESIRRRVLWIIPLAIIGVIIVSQLQKPIDEADAIRQTTKFCLFATGLLVTLTVIILACTNLPREIENRVIYTVVTKPTTRFEIVLGKIMGFARVSATILLIMGLFSWGYLSLRAWNLRRDIGERLAANAVDNISRPSLEHYKQFGLLTSKRLESPVNYAFYSRPPAKGSSVHWMWGGDGDVIVPFDISPEALTVPGEEAAGIAPNGLIIHARVLVDAKAPPTSTPTTKVAKTAFISPLLVQPNSTTTEPAIPAVSFSILDQFQNLVLGADKINNGKPVTLRNSPGVQDVYAFIPASNAALIASKRRIFISMSGGLKAAETGVDDHAFEILLPSKAPPKATVISPPDDPQNPGHPFAPIFRGRQGTYGQQLRGGTTNVPFAVFAFRGTSAGNSEDIPVELRVGVERTGIDSDEESPTKLELSILNQTTGAQSAPIIILPENGRTSYFNVPRADVQGGNFDVLMRCLTDEQWVGLKSDSLSIVSGQEPFAWNLLKSLVVIWLMSVLVVIIAIFSSTFLSWPIALVLTVVILLGHWGVQELGDSTAPGVGNMVANDLGFRDPAKAKVVSSSVEALSTMLRNVSDVLPDIGQYSASDEIERGMIVPMERLWEALKVTGLFGIPMIALAYVFLKNKEVAP